MNGDKLNALTQAMHALATAVLTIRNPAPPTSTEPIHDLFTSGRGLNLETRTGIQAFEDMSKPLLQIWDGKISSFPSVVKNLRLRTNKVKWNSTGAPGILQVDRRDILTSYHSLTDVMIETARITRTSF